MVELRWRHVHYRCVAAERWCCEQVQRRRALARASMVAQCSSGMVDLLVRTVTVMVDADLLVRTKMVAHGGAGWMRVAGALVVLRCCFRRAELQWF